MVSRIVIRDSFFLSARSRSAIPAALAQYYAIYQTYRSHFNLFDFFRCFTNFQHQQFNVFSFQILKRKQVACVLRGYSYSRDILSYRKRKFLKRWLLNNTICQARIIFNRITPAVSSAPATTAHEVSRNLRWGPSRCSFDKTSNRGNQKRPLRNGILRPAPAATAILTATVLKFKI